MSPPARTVALHAGPRAAEALSEHIDHWEGLRRWRNLGWLFLLAPWAPQLALIPAQWIWQQPLLVRPIVPLLALCVIGSASGLLMILTARQQAEARLRAMTHGELLDARVVTHSPGAMAFPPAPGGLLIQALLKTSDGRSRIVLGTFPDDARSWLPVGSTTQVLCDPDSGGVLFPARFGIRFWSAE